jgi:zinc transporter, ZIP family
MSYAGLMAVGSSRGFRDRTTTEGRYWIALAMAIGIGVHNLGEGLAVGASIATGEIALGSFLIVGFILHNVTEGVGIGAPMAQDRAGLPRLLFLTFVAGAPAIAGTWLGGFAFTPLLAVVFLAVGAGAILQVIVEVWRLIIPAGGDSGLRNVSISGMNLLGIAAGIGIMYTTALLV